MTLQRDQILLSVPMHHRGLDKESDLEDPTSVYLAIGVNYLHWLILTQAGDWDHLLFVRFS